MTRYFLHVVGATGKVVDPEGIELPSLDEARVEAILDARWLLSAAILEGRDISGRSIEICDEDGNSLMIVPFRDAVSRAE